MEFQVNTNNVILSQINQAESGEYNVTECKFSFSSEYDGLTKIAVFTGANGEGDAYKLTILNNKCEIPTELLAETQIVQIGVYAYDVDGTELVLRYSPMPTKFFIHKGSFVVNAVNMSKPTATEVEQLQSQITHNRNDIDELEATYEQYGTDINELKGEVAEIKAEQTEQNTNIQKNTDDIVEINQNISAINTDIGDLEQDINVINQNIDDLEQDLTNYSLIAETGSQINLNVNSTNYQITAILKDKNGNVIYTSNAIDLPIESMIVNASYDNTTKEIVLTLQNGNTLRISIADLVSGLVSETQLQTILANYYTKTEVDDLLSAKANQSSLDTTNQNLTNLAGRVSTNETDIANIKTEQTTQNTNIEELQSQVETLQEDLESANAEIAELNTDITNMRKAMRTVDGQGTDITLENTTENKFVEFGLEGRTEQEQLTGKNLLDGANPTKNNSAIVSMTNNTIKVSSTAINTTPSVIYEIDNVQQGDTYRINAIIKNSNGQIVLQTKQDDTWTTYVILPYINGTSITSYSYVIGTNVEAIRYLLYADKSIPTGASESNYENVIVTKNNSDMTYEPYCGRIPAPNSIYKIPIKNVTGNANVKIQNENKNLFNLTIEDFQNGEVMGYGKKVYLTLKPNTYYTLSSNEAEGTINATNIWFNGVQSDGNGVFINHPRTTRTDENGKLFIAIRTAKITTILENYWIQLEEGTTATSYVPHQEQNYPFTFAKGQRGMQGTQPKDDGIHNTRTQLVIDGTENITLSTATVGTSNYGKFDITISKRANANDRTALCSHLKYKFQGWATAGNENTFSFTVPTILRLLFDINEFPTVEALKTYLANNNMTFEFVTEQPEIIPYNETQQTQYNAMKEARSYDDITYISSESDELGFDMKAIAVADANKVIDKELQEIKNVITVLGGELNV